MGYEVRLDHSLGRDRRLLPELRGLDSISTVSAITESRREDQQQGVEHLVSRLLQLGHNYRAEGHPTDQSESGQVPEQTFCPRCPAVLQAQSTVRIV